ncbi:MAG: TonB-dependent receptor [Saprospiraceae bacterium]|nr:TonB-dependent receptor [Saprospiraceae bacterium]
MNSRNKLVVRLTYAVCFLTALPVISLKSQHTIIKGTLIEKSNNLPLEYASVALLSNLDSSVIAGTTTNAKGDFLLAKVDSGDYIGQIVFLGFKTKYIQLSVSKNSKEIDLAYITMESSTDLLNEITVTGNRINSTNKLDKQTYSADQFEASKGGSAIDALKNLPSVAVNSAGEISIRGSTGFLILINGKPHGHRCTDYLKSIAC